MAEFGEEFEDDFFNDLVHDDLDALEQKAFESTQAPKRHHQSRDNDTYDDDLRPSQLPFRSHTSGDDEDEVIDTSRHNFGNLPIHPAISSFQLAPARRDAVANTSNGNPASNRVSEDSSDRNLGVSGRTHLPHRSNGQSTRVNHTEIDNGDDSGNINDTESVRVLQVQIEELNKKLRAANDLAQTKAGEVVIVRSNYERRAREQEQRLAELQREVVVVSDRHRSEVEQARRQQEQISVESRFADHDRILDRTRKRQQPAKHDQDVIVQRPVSKTGPKPITPRKTRHASPGDGFDKEERSPAKHLSQIQQRTPKGAEKKRKRPEQSPVQPLLLQDDNYGLDLGNDNVLHTEPQGGHPVKFDQHLEQSYKVLPEFLDRRIEVGKKRTIERFVELQFPSDPDTALSSLVFDTTSRIRSQGSASDLPSSLCALIIGLWTRCLAEKYFEPVVYLSDWISFILQRTPTAIPSVIDDLIPILQKTADVNLIPRFKKSLRRATADLGTENEHVNATDCLELLIQVASFCEDDHDLTERFWTLVRVDFLSMLLRPAQDIVDVKLTCKLLVYGVRPSGLGPVLGDTDSQATNNGFSKSRAEDHLIDRLSALMVETPRRHGDQASNTPIETAQLRLEILALVEAMTRNDYCAALFVQQKLALGRLVRCMNDEFHDAMELRHGWEHRMHVINQATRLLYHFVYRFAEIIDINEKLRVIPGGAHKYLIVLTRLAFSEGGMLGSHIDEDVIDCAHELLEDHVNPEEGEALMAAFRAGYPRQ